MGIKVIINESQLKKLREFNGDEPNIKNVGEQLKTIECTGEGIKTLVTRKLNELGYEDIKMTFIGHQEETNHLMYSIYTNDPMFVIEAQSSQTEQPCLEIVNVKSYQKV